MSESTDLAVSLGAGTISFEIDGSLYPQDALYGAAYVFLDRCYVLLDRVSDNRVRVLLRGKTKDAALDGDALAGEFQNELLGQTWRRKIAEDNRSLIEAITARALGGAAGPPGLDDLLEMDVGSETAFDDPLGIAMSWEEKYAKGKSDAAKTAKDAAPADAAPAEDPPEVTP